MRRRTRTERPLDEAMAMLMGKGLGVFVQAPEDQGGGDAGPGAAGVQEGRQAARVREQEQGQSPFCSHQEHPVSWGLSMVRLWVQEVRLNRALEEAERAKAALAAERTNKRGDVQQERKDVEKLEGGYRVLCA